MAVDEEALAIDLAASRAKKKRRTGWKKFPDQPLEIVIHDKALRRERCGALRASVRRSNDS